MLSLKWMEADSTQTRDMSCSIDDSSGMPAHGENEPSRSCGSPEFSILGSTCRWVTAAWDFGLSLSSHSVVGRQKSELLIEMHTLFFRFEIDFFVFNFKVFILYKL